jgi:uncharacterized protein (TIGR03435 family)
MTQRGPASKSSGDRLVLPDVTVRSLIEYAYDVAAFRVTGGPAWSSTDRWSILAKAPRPVGSAEMRLLVQHLLQDRFGLRIHRETREVPVFELVMAREDGHLGPQMRVSDIDCEPLPDGERAPAGASQERPADSSQCTGRVGFGPNESITWRGASVARLVRLLAARMEREVIDRTA